MEARTATSSAERSSRRVFLREHRAVIVLERRGASLTPADMTAAAPYAQPRATEPPELSSSPPAGWNWILGNAPLARLFEEWLGEADADWAATVVPEEVAGSLGASLERNSATSPSLICYNGQLKLETERFDLDSGDPVLLIVNGHQFPACDVRQAIAAHRGSRCDVTVFELQQQRAAPMYQEKLRVDADGHVARVDRVYGATGGSPGVAHEWPALMLLSQHAVRRLANVSFPHRLYEWPAFFVRSGLRVGGATLAGQAFDLHDDEAIRALAEQILRVHPHWLANASNLSASDHYPKLWQGRNVVIGNNVEFIGPVALGDDVQVGDNAVIVGPTAVGRCSRIAAGALVRRRFLPPETLFHAAAESMRLRRPSPAERDRKIRLQSVLEANHSPRLASARHRAYLSIKRGMDIAGAMLFLCATLPFFPLIALAIKLSSPGSAFYGHIRQGLAGKAFRCWKFRTMVPNAEQMKEQFKDRNEVDGPQFKIKNDPRIFAVGRWLRKLNIDEWPQFFNVLRGEMSLVGPRPSPEKENQMCPAWREARLSVRPGITGLWQVSRQRGEETDFQEWIYYDVQYVKKQSLKLDLKILLKTFKVVLKGS